MSIFRGRWVDPSSDYIYDPLYRLIEASGREHLGQVEAIPSHSYNDVPRELTSSTNDGKLMGNDIENYLYDAVGNFELMQHCSTS